MRSIKGTAVGPKVHRHGQVSRVGLDERPVRLQALRVGSGCLTTSSLRVTSQPGGAQRRRLVEMHTESRAP